MKYSSSRSAPARATSTIAMTSTTRSEKPPRFRRLDVARSRRSRSFAAGAGRRPASASRPRRGARACAEEIQRLPPRRRVGDQVLAAFALLLRHGRRGAGSRAGSRSPSRRSRGAIGQSRPAGRRRRPARPAACPPARLTVARARPACASTRSTRAPVARDPYGVQEDRARETRKRTSSMPALPVARPRRRTRARSLNTVTSAMRASQQRRTLGASSATARCSGTLSARVWPAAGGTCRGRPPRRGRRRSRAVGDEPSIGCRRPRHRDVAQARIRPQQVRFMTPDRHRVAHDPGRLATAPARCGEGCVTNRPACSTGRKQAAAVGSTRCRRCNSSRGCRRRCRRCSAGRAERDGVVLQIVRDRTDAAGSVADPRWRTDRGRRAAQAARRDVDAAASSDR